MKPDSTRHPAWQIAAIVLVLANIVYFAWSQGAFAAFGMLPSRLTQTEPYRMERQVRPTLLQVLKEAPPVPVNVLPTEPVAIPEAPLEIQPQGTPMPAPTLP